jgi:hypothetical protein
VDIWDATGDSIIGKLSVGKARKLWKGNFAVNRGAKK